MTLNTKTYEKTNSKIVLTIFDELFEIKPSILLIIRNLSESCKRKGPQLRDG